MLKETLKEFNNLINNQTFLVYGPEKCEPVTPCIDVYKSIVQPDRSHNKLKLIIVVRGDLQNNDLIGDTTLPTDYMRTFK